MKRFLAAAATGALTIGLLAAPASAESPFGPTPYFVKDINPGASSADLYDGARYATALGSKVVFGAQSGTQRELWVSDGTAAGTKLLKNINLTPDSGSFPDSFTVLNGKAYFAASNATHGNELWVTDGTTAGTKMVKDIYAGPDASGPEAMTVSGGLIYFRATTPVVGRELWKSNGTAAGTQLVKDINTNPGGNSTPDRFTRFGDRVVFSATDATSGNEPWISDGTPTGTVRLKDINTTSAGASSTPSEFTVSGGRLFFQARSSAANSELWVSDGAAATTEVRDIYVGSGGSSPASIVPFDGDVLFSASTAGFGTELWASGGTAGTTGIVRDIIEGSTGSSPGDLTPFLGSVFFRADNELWVTKGGPSNTKRFRDTNGEMADTPQSFRAVGPLLLFSGDTDDEGTELWQSNGTAAGTKIARNLAFSGNDSSPSPVAVVSNTLFFAANDDTGKGRELWAYTTRGSTTKGYPASSYSRSAGKNKKIYLTVKVTATGTTPIGRVTLKKGSTIIGYGDLVGGKKSIRITKALGKGTHSIKAYYSGSVRAQTSVSAYIKIKVR